MWVPIFRCTLAQLTLSKPSDNVSVSREDRQIAPYEDPKIVRCPSGRTSLAIRTHIYEDCKNVALVTQLPRMLAIAGLRYKLEHSALVTLDSNLVHSMRHDHTRGTAAKNFKFARCREMEEDKFTITMSFPSYDILAGESSHVASTRIQTAETNAPIFAHCFPLDVHGDFLKFILHWTYLCR